MDKLVYFISDGKYVKIGQSDNPFRRLKGLQGANARKLELIHVTRTLSEGELQTKFSKFRVRGEWFMYDFEIQMWIYREQGYFEPNGGLEL